MLTREDPFGLLGSLGRSFSDMARQPMQQMVLRALLRGEVVYMNHEGAMKEQAIALLRKGFLLLDDDGSFRFPSPLHEWHYRKQVIYMIGLSRTFAGSSSIISNLATCMIWVQLYSTRAASLDITPAGFSTFLRDCIERLSAEQLRGSLCRDKDGDLYEADYQKQFYAAASMYLPNSYRISPEVGQVTHAGFVIAVVYTSRVALGL